MYLLKRLKYKFFKINNYFRPYFLEFTAKKIKMNAFRSVNQAQFRKITLKINTKKI